jgi:metal-sulfur cluster biosynthetic enzyme
VQPHDLDHGPHRRLRVAEPEGAAVDTQPPRQHGEVEHQGGVPEPQLSQVDGHVAARVDGAGKGASARALRRPVLVSSTTEYRGRVIELDDPRNLHNAAVRGKGDARFSGAPGRNYVKWGTAYSGRPDRGLNSKAMATVDEVTDALRDVIDPELGLDFVELGLIYDVQIDGGTVRVTYTLTSPGCPIGPQVSEQIDEFVSELEGVEEVQPTMTFSPPWTPDRMSEDAKFALGF